MQIHVLCKNVGSTFDFEIEGEWFWENMKSNADWILFKDTSGNVYMFSTGEIIAIIGSTP